MSNTQQPAALLKSVTDAFGPDGEATQFDAETWSRIHAAIISTLALNQELLAALKKARKAQEHALDVVRSYEEGGECSESGQFILEDLASIDAAIAKATGGEV